MLRRALMAGLIVTLGSCGGDESAALECSIDISDVIEALVIDPSDGTARMIRSRWNPDERTGSATISEYRYDVAFPATADRAELRYRVDRRTLQATRWFLDDSGDPYLNLEATCRRLEEIPTEAVYGP